MKLIPTPLEQNLTFRSYLFNTSTRMLSACDRGQEFKISKMMCLCSKVMVELMREILRDRKMDFD